MIELGFRDKFDNVEYINIKPNDCNLSLLWLNRLDRLMDKQSIVYVKNFSLLGFNCEYRTPQQVCDELDRAIDIINSNTEYKITEDYSLLRIRYDQQLLNKLHHHFETAHGQVWNPTRLMAISSGEVRLSICMLNHCCHWLETWYDEENKKERWNNRVRNGYFYYSVLGANEKIELPQNEKKNFTKTVDNGLVYLHYAQTGKTWYEAYLDNDDDVTDAGISEHRLISGEFDCHFGNTYEFPTDEEFSEWLLSKGADPTNEQNGLGYAEVGRVLNISKEEALSFFTEYTDFYSIKFNGKVQTYDYRYYDETFYTKSVRKWGGWDNDPQNN
jgi:hypothetical protein